MKQILLVHKVRQQLVWHKHHFLRHHLFKRPPRSEVAKPRAGPRRAGKNPPLCFRMSSFRLWKLVFAFASFRIHPLYRQSLCFSSALSFTLPLRTLCAASQRQLTCSGWIEDSNASRCGFFAAWSRRRKSRFSLIRLLIFVHCNSTAITSLYALKSDFVKSGHHFAWRWLEFAANLQKGGKPFLVFGKTLQKTG